MTRGLCLRQVFVNNLNNNSNADANNDLNNNARFARIVQAYKAALFLKMKSENSHTQNLYDELCSYKNLELAYKKARKGKTTKPYVIEFERERETERKPLTTAN